MVRPEILSFVLFALTIGVLNPGLVLAKGPPDRLTGLEQSGVGVFAQGFRHPRDLAFDRQGFLYVSWDRKHGDGVISKVDEDGKAAIFAMGFRKPAGLAFNQAGDLFVADEDTGEIPRITPDGTVHPFAAGLRKPQDLAFDREGNLYVSWIRRHREGIVSKIDPIGVATIFATGFRDPRGLAINATGDLFITDEDTGEIKKVTPTGGISTFASGLRHPKDLAFDSFGNLYVSHEKRGGRYKGEVSLIIPDGTVSLLAFGFDDPRGLAFNRAKLARPAPQAWQKALNITAANTLYVADHDRGEILDRTPTPTVPNEDNDLRVWNRGDGVILWWTEEESTSRYVMYRSPSLRGPWTNTGSLGETATSGNDNIDSRIGGLFYRIDAVDASGNILKSYKPVRVPPFINEDAPLIISLLSGRTVAGPGAPPPPYNTPFITDAQFINKDANLRADRQPF